MQENDEEINKPSENTKTTNGLPGKQAFTKAFQQLADLADSNEFFDERGRFIPNAFAQHLTQKIVFKTLEENDETYYYALEEGVYQPGETLVKKIAQRILNHDSNNLRVNETLGAVKRLTYAKREQPAPQFIPLANGVFDYYKNELTPFTPKHFFTAKLPIHYNPSFDCPAFKNFLEQVLPDELDRETIRQLFAYCLWRGYELQKAFLFVGSGANGKSTTLGVLRAFLGHENISALTLQEVSDPAYRFSSSILDGKLANICPDIPKTPLRATGQFKALTGGDAVKAEKKFGGIYSFVNSCKLIFSTNQIPKTDDDQTAFFRRWIIIPFKQQFLGDKADANLLHKLTTPEELSGILNWCLPALLELQEKGRFAIEEDVEKTREYYIRSSNSVQAFRMDELEYAVDSWISKEEMYVAYVKFCERCKLVPESKNEFGRELPRHIEVRESRPKIDNRQVKAWLGVSFTNETREVPKDPTQTTNSGSKLLLDFED